MVAQTHHSHTSSLTYFITHITQVTQIQHTDPVPNDSILILGQPRKSPNLI